MNRHHVGRSRHRPARPSAPRAAAPASHPTPTTVRQPSTVMRVAVLAYWARRASRNAPGRATCAAWKRTHRTGAVRRAGGLHERRLRRLREAGRRPATTSPRPMPSRSTGRTGSGDRSPSWLTFCCSRLRFLRRLLLRRRGNGRTPTRPRRAGTAPHPPPPAATTAAAPGPPAARRGSPPAPSPTDRCCSISPTSTASPPRCHDQPCSSRSSRSSADQHEDDQPGEPRDPEPSGERPQQQRRREDRQAGGAPPGAGQPPPAVRGRLRGPGVPTSPAGARPGVRRRAGRPGSAVARPAARTPREGAGVWGARPSPAEGTGERPRTRFRTAACRPGGS